MMSHIPLSHCTCLVYTQIMYIHTCTTRTFIKCFTLVWIDVYLGFSDAVQSTNESCCQTPTLSMTTSLLQAEEVILQLSNPVVRTIPYIIIVL